MRVANSFANYPLHNARHSEGRSKYSYIKFLVDCLEGYLQGPMPRRRLPGRLEARALFSE